MAKFRYAVVVTGEVEGRNKTNAYLNALMGVSINARLLTFPHDIAIRVEPVESQVVNPSLEEVMQEALKKAGRDGK